MGLDLSIESIWKKGKNIKCENIVNFRELLIIDN